jgi:DNA-damage-inducible protein D
MTDDDDPGALAPEGPPGDGGPRTRSPFERIMRVAEDGSQYWSSRDLATTLGYDSYRNFEKAVIRAKDACENSGHAVPDHFHNATEAVALGKGATRQVDVVYLSRYACYLVIQNADPRKPMVALGQTYFTVQTRRQELADAELEDSLRVKLREEIKLHNKQLAKSAYTAGVRTPYDYAVFNDHGYKGLYNGIGAQQIRENRGLKRSQDILDYMGSTELAANLFRATQTEELIRRGGVRSKDQANMTHFQVGVRVREAMKDISGIMPEELPVAESIKKVERRLKKRAETGRLEGGDPT